jgi:hypothetical protein
MKIKDKGIYKIPKCPLEKYAYFNLGYSVPLYLIKG